MDRSNLESKDLNSAAQNKLIKIFWAVETVLAISGVQRIYTENLKITVIIAIAMISILPVIFLAKKGKIELGSNILLLSLTIILLGFVWSYNGLRDEVLFVFPAIIMICLLMGTQRFAFFIFILISINILLIGYFNELGYIHNISQDSNLEAAFLLIVILTFVSYIAWLISSEMKKANQALRENQNELENRVKERTIELEQSIKNLTNTQEQLVHTEKMASLGRLVAGVAHEINTPVGIAITASSHLEDATGDFLKLYDNKGVSKKSLANYLDTAKTSSTLVQSNLKRAADLILSFKEVAVDQSNDEIREFELKQYLHEIFTSLHPQTKRSNCQININCPSDILIKASPGAIAQIITNLTINAIIHAFEDNQHGIITLNIEQKNEQINMQFIDSGAGISSENLAHIFEPFFTTKRNDGGSGLGMQIVYNLVTKSLNGNIECTSTLGVGTTFLINFPIK